MDSFERLRHYAEFVRDSDEYNCLIVQGKSSSGKTYMVEQVLGRGHVLVSGHLTPLALFDVLKANSDKNIFIDDVPSLFKSDVALSYLNAASFGSRFVDYITNDDRLLLATARSGFVFSGKIFLCVNSTPRSHFFEALKQRSCFVVHEPTNKEVVAQLKKVKADEEVLSFCLDAFGEYGDLNFRVFDKICALKKMFPENWRDLSLPFASIHRRKSMFDAVKGLPVAEAIKTYESNGLSERTFFRDKAELCSKTANCHCQEVSSLHNNEVVK